MKKKIILYIFKQFLIENKLYHKILINFYLNKDLELYEKNVIACLNNSASPTDILYNLFYWNSTYESYQFWSDKDYKWRKFFSSKAQYLRQYEE